MIYFSRPHNHTNLSTFVKNKLHTLRIESVQQITCRSDFLLLPFKNTHLSPSYNHTKIQHTINLQPSDFFQVSSHTLKKYKTVTIRAELHSLWRSRVVLRKCVNRRRFIRVFTDINTSYFHMSRHSQ